MSNKNVKEELNNINSRVYKIASLSILYALERSIITSIGSAIVIDNFRNFIDKVANE